MNPNHTNRLIPEPRVDKNGRVVTRHVKPVATTAAKSMPAPVIGAKVTGKLTGRSITATERQLKQSFYALQLNDYSPDDKLVRLMESDGSGYARFSANHVEFCEVLSVTSPDNAIVLLSQGIRTSAEAIQFLKEKRLGKLVRDKSWESDQLLIKKIDPLAYAEICRHGADEFSTPDCVIEAAEAQSIKLIREWQNYPSVPRRILDGAMSIKDIKIIGAGRAVNADPRGTDMIHALVSIHKNQVSYTAHDVRAIINEFGAGTVAIYNMGSLLSLADKYSTEFTLGLCYPDYASRLDMFLNNKHSDAKEMIAYADSVCRYQNEHGFNLGTSYPEMIELYKAGIEPGMAAIGIRDGVRVEQLIAIQNEGITPGVSSGWL